MTRSWAAQPIRVRLTAWYAGSLAVMLVIYATATFLAVRHEFLEQLDEDLHHDFEAAEDRLMRMPDGRIDWSGNQHHDPEVDEDRAYEVWSATGDQIHRSGATVVLAPPALASGTAGYRFDSTSPAGEPWRTLTAPVTIDGQAVVLRVARAQRRVRSQLSEILFVLIVGVPLIVGLAGAGGYVLARRALAPIDHLGTEARRITAENLHERLSVANQHDEVGRLASVINDTLSRLRDSFDQLRRFTADASHELRTPLAVIRGIGEAAVAERRSPVDYQEAIGSMLEEVDRLTNLVDTLLRLSRADAGTVRLTNEAIDLTQVAKDASTSLGVLAEERQQRLTVDMPSPLLVVADPLVLREAITNVLDNAIKYGPPGSTVAVRAWKEGTGAVLAIADQGPGIAAEHRERIFDRFFRIDEGRSRDHGGIGLGLSIAKWAVEINGGRIIVNDRAGGGAEFHIQLPLAG